MTKRTLFTCWVALVLLMGGARAQAQALPIAGVQEALKDSLQLPDIVRVRQRYLWNPTGSEEVLDAVAVALNTAVSQSSSLVRPAVSADGTLIRVDLSLLAPNEQDYIRVGALWEQLAAVDPYFHVVEYKIEGIDQKAVSAPVKPESPYKPLNRDNEQILTESDMYYGRKHNLGLNELVQRRLALNAKAEAEEELLALAKQSDEKVRKAQVEARFASEVIPDEVELPGPDDFEPVEATPVQDEAPEEIVVVSHAPHLGEFGSLLEEATGSTAPILYAPWFVNKVLTTLDNGFYYQFRNIVANETKWGDYIASRGSDEERSENLDAKEKAIVFVSGVSGKERMIGVFSGIGVRPSVGTGLIAVTDDPFDEDRDARQSPIRNLLTFRGRAREVILELPNGMHEFTLWNEDGVLQEVVPPNVASDHLIPAPYTRNLQPAISCMRCHGPHEGWMPFNNDIQDVIGTSLDISDDLSSPNSQPETIGDLRYQYSGDLRGALQAGRNSYDNALFRLTAKPAVKALEAVANVYNTYVYDSMDPKQACWELGFPAEDNMQGIQILAALLPPLPMAPDGLSPEDPVIGLFKADKAIGRLPWEGVYADAANRAIVNYESLYMEIVGEELPKEQETPIETGARAIDVILEALGVETEEEPKPVPEAKPQSEQQGPPKIPAGPPLPPGKEAPKIPEEPESSEVEEEETQRLLPGPVQIEDATVILLKPKTVSEEKDAVDLGMIPKK